MNVIITGANGFIGSHLLQKFNSEGYNATGWDIVADEQRNVQKVDLMYSGEIEKALNESKPDIIIHCAGNASVGSSFEDVKRDYDLNVSITHDLLFTMQKLGFTKTRFVFLSSASVYGNPEKLPIDESFSKNPISPYALHKSMCEDVCYYFINNYDFDIKIARIFSAYGSGLRKQVFWDMYQKYLTKGQIDMFGSGKESRDFIHIEDLENALFLISTKRFNEVVVNVGNNEEVYIEKIAHLFAENIDNDPPKVRFNGEVRQGDPNNWNADISLLKGLGYVQKVSIEEGIRRYCQWLIMLR